MHQQIFALYNLLKLISQLILPKINLFVSIINSSDKTNDYIIILYMIILKYNGSKIITDNNDKQSTMIIMIILIKNILINE